MASTFSPNLRLELIGTGEQQGTWGATTNTNLGTLLEEAIGGYISVAVTDGADTTLTTNNGSADQSRNMVINLTGALTATRNVICPAIEKLYVVKNATTGGYAVTFKVSGQTGVSIPNGATVLLYVDGTDARSVTGSIASQAASNVSITGGSITGITDLAIADGGTGASTAAGAATNLGLGTGDSPQFAGVNVGNATDTTITRAAAGVIAVEGNQVPSPGSVAQGDVLYYNGTTWARLGAGTSGQYLQTGGANANPSWTTFSAEYYSQSGAPSNASNTAVWYASSDNILYMYANSQWWQIGFFVGPNADRGIFGGGDSSSAATIDYVIITSTGNATAFGALTVARAWLAGCSNGTRGVFGGGTSGTVQNIVDYVTISTAGNATDFGDLRVARYKLGACSNGTRGVFGGGTNSSGVLSNAIDYITIATIGNATGFGDLTVAREVSGLSNGTRGVFGGGLVVSTYQNVIDYITIASAGNATDFGDLTVARNLTGACSSTTRGVFGGGTTASVSNVIDYITIATTGNATDFGDLTVARSGAGGCSNGTRGIFGGGVVSSTKQNVIDYITIASAGNATDFGDLTVARDYPGALSGFYGA